MNDLSKGLWDSLYSVVYSDMNISKFNLSTKGTNFFKFCKLRYEFSISIFNENLDKVLAKKGTI